MNHIILHIPGEPVAKGRPRFTRFGTTYTPAATKTWETLAQWHAREAMCAHRPLPGPVTVHIVATFAVPPSWPKWKQRAALDGMLFHTAKPDEDNVGKAIKDAMNGIVYVDDSQIHRSTVDKQYGAEPGVKVEVHFNTGMCSQDKNRPLIGSAG